MFVRKYTKRLKNGSTASHAYLVKNSWNPYKKKTQQRIVATLGKVAELPHTGVIEEIIIALDKFAQKEGFAALSKGIVLDDLSKKRFHRQTYDWGSLYLVRHLLLTLSLTNIFSRLARKDKDKKVSHDKTLAVISSLLAFQLQGKSTASERAAFLWYKNKVFLPNKQPLLKDDLYRTLDFLTRNKDEIEKQYYCQNQSLFNQQLDLVLFDTTSIYYWGEKGEAALKTKQKPDEALLRYSGYSKDKRTDLKQLIAGVLMAEDLSGNAVPVAHEIFPGSQSDFVSFPEIIKKVKAKYNIKKIVFVADKGMVSEENLRSLEEQGLEYILGVRTRQLNPILKKALILNIQKQDMKKIKDNLYAKEFKMKDFLKTGSIWPHPRKSNRKINGRQALDQLANSIYQKLDFYRSRTGSEIKDKASIKQRLLKRRYFICLNPFIAQDNQVKRKFFRKIIKNKIKYQQNKQWIVKNGYKKYLKLNNLDLQLDEEKLNSEQDYDGKWILITNSQTLSPSLAARRYKSLSFVEQGFKDLKSLIKVRPVFHFKEERIKAHIFVSFLVLILKWYVCHQLNSVSKTTGRRFIQKMNELKAVEIDSKHKVYVRTEINPALQQQMKSLRMTIPGKIILDLRPVKEQWLKKPGRPRKKRIHSGQVKLF